MIHIGEVVKCGRNRGRVGAIISYKNRFCIVTAAHVVKGDKRVQISGIECNVATVIEGYDLVIIEARDAVEYVEIGKPAIGDANLFTTEHTIPCRIQSISSPIYYIYFRCSDMPMPGDSGAPIIQNDCVVGMLSSIFINNCTGLIVSSDVLKRLQQAAGGI